MLTQDQINKIILALLAINTAMMIYCCVKRSSEEFSATIPKGMSGLLPKKK